MDNYEQLMPEQVINWDSDAQSCHFTIKGMAELGMRIIEKQPNNQIVIQSDGKVPFNFNLYIDIEKMGETESNLQMNLDADMNPMLAMMAKKPLQNLLNHMVGRVVQHFG
jgi:carbon monoxide dehydrogenase subunit G